MPGRGRGIVGEEVGERSENVCWTVHFYVCLFVCFSPHVEPMKAYFCHGI